MRAILMSCNKVTYAAEKRKREDGAVPRSRRDDKRTVQMRDLSSSERIKNHEPRP